MRGKPAEVDNNAGSFAILRIFFFFFFKIIVEDPISGLNVHHLVSTPMHGRSIGTLNKRLRMF